jgi:hypothetical protein
MSRRKRREKLKERKYEMPKRTKNTGRDHILRKGDLTLLPSDLPRLRKLQEELSYSASGPVILPAGWAKEAIELWKKITN